MVVPSSMALQGPPEPTCLAQKESLLGVNHRQWMSNPHRVFVICAEAPWQVSLAGRQCSLFIVGGFSEEASSRDPQPCNVEEFPSLLARRIAYPAPHYMLFTADIDEHSGLPWCPDCARMLDSARERVKAAGGTLMEVQVREYFCICVLPLGSLKVHSQILP